jgi:hypothetical protein
MSEVDAQIAWYTFWLAVLTAALVLATIGLGAVTLWRLLRQTTDTRIANRAYLSVAPLGIEPFGKIETIAHLSVQNVGKLPAQDVSWFIAHVVSQNGRLNAFPIDEAKFYGKSLVIHPGAEMKRSHDCTLSDAEVDAIMCVEPRTFLYVWGGVRYLDGFAKVRRFTRFCHRYENRGARRVLEGRYKGHFMIAAESMRYHQFGNEAN